VKKLGLIDKFIFFFNSVFALCLLLSLLVPYIPPQKFPLLALLSLVVPPLLIINVLFFLFWLLRVKRQMLLSLIVLIICAVQFNSFYRLGFGEAPALKENQLKVMNYNVRLFNIYDWIKDEDIPLQISEFIAESDPDVISFQEYSGNKRVNLSSYPHSYIHLVKQKPEFGQAIYSKYPIIDKGSLDFKGTSNNAIFADIVKDNDTIRIYNIHLQSLQINESDVDFDQEASKRLLRRISQSFQIQQNQAESISVHSKSINHKSIIMADLNNTAFSYAYRKIKGNKKDAFAERGKGLGTTYLVKNIPLRIDFILTDPAFTINEFTTHFKQLSDHFAISSVLSWE